jgi:hypothetical protein
MVTDSSKEEIRARIEAYLDTFKDQAELTYRAESLMGWRNMLNELDAMARKNDLTLSELEACIADRRSAVAHRSRIEELFTAEFADIARHRLAMESKWDRLIGALERNLERP